MAIDEHELWRLFNLVYVDYLEPTQALCFDLAQGRLDADALADRLGSKEPSSKIRERSESYYWLGKAYNEQNSSSKILNPFLDNLHRQWVNRADRFHAQLRGGHEPANVDHAQEVARQFAEEFAQLDIQSLKAEVELACALLRNQPDVITYDEIAVIKGIKKKTV